LERAAQNLGATPLQTFWRVTLPLLRPGIVAGAIFAAIISFGELAVTLLIAGARTTTLPLRIFSPRPLDRPRANRLSYDGFGVLRGR
jgi:putative spermidine/putrescine transport system permease protein